jgi:hypothetical protein
VPTNVSASLKGWPEGTYFYSSVRYILVVLPDMASKAESKDVFFLGYQSLCATSRDECGLRFYVFCPKKAEVCQENTARVFGAKSQLLAEIPASVCDMRRFLL